MHGRGSDPSRQHDRQGSAARCRARAHQHGQDPSRHRAHAGPPERHDRLSPPPARARELRPHRPSQRSGSRGPRHGRGEDRPLPSRLLGVHGRGDAPRPPRRVPRRRRDPARRRRGARPCLHGPPAPCARPRRDHAPRRRYHPPGAAPAPLRGRVREPAALLQAHLYRAEEAHAAAAAQRGRRLLGPGCLRPRRADAAPAGRSRRCPRRAQPAHAQRPGRHVPGGRGRLSRRHRRHRHGAQHGCRPCRLLEPDQVRRLGAAPPPPGGAGPDRRARRALHGRRQLRRHRRARPA